MLERLERIETLDRVDAPPGVLLAELRELVREAETWARREGDPRATAAVDAAAEALDSLVAASRRFAFPLAGRPRA